jgi:predicted HTH transcriptional regulator
MFEVMERNYLHPPEFRQDGFMFQVTLRNTPIYDVQTQRWLGQFADYSLNGRQRRILAYARQHGNQFTNQAYQKVGEVDRDLAYREIQEMIRAGIVVAPERYGRVYTIVEPGKEVPLPEDLQAILPTLREKGFVKNEDLREIWQVGRPAAWSRIRELMEAGYLRREGEKRWTRYYPSEKLSPHLKS